MDLHDRIFVAGHCGLGGRAVVRGLPAGDAGQLILQTRGEQDLTEQAAVETFLESERPDSLEWHARVPLQQGLQQSVEAFASSNS